MSSLVTDTLVETALGTTDRLALRLRGGDVRRYHAHPGVRPQSVAEHSWRVAVLAHYLWPAKPQLVRAALLHDVAEALVGDLPAPVKRAGAGAALAALEADYEVWLGIYADLDLSKEDQTRLKICDYADLCLHTRWTETADARLVYRNGCGYVRDLLHDLPDREEAERVADVLFNLLGDIFIPATERTPSGQEHPFGYDAAQDTPAARAGFDLDVDRVTRGTRFELLAYADQYTSINVVKTGRYGYVVKVLQDGDADVRMDDGLQPYQVKWRQIRPIVDGR